MAKSNIEKKVNPILSCPIGQHYVKTHKVNYPLSAAHPNGHTALRLEHCASNPVRKTKKKKKMVKQKVSKIEKHTLSSKEIEDISTHILPKLIDKQSLPPLSKYPGSEKYDLLILVWVQYWNDIFKLEEPLDPKLIKALMASESSFCEDPLPGHVKKEDVNKLKNSAKGLMQITQQTLKILNDPKGELKDYVFNIKSKELLTPSVNICASVRWIFHKKVMATHRLKREATWMEAVAEYKGYLKDIVSGKNLEPSGMENISDKYTLLLDTE